MNIYPHHKSRIAAVSLLFGTGDSRLVTKELRRTGAELVAKNLDHALKVEKQT